MCGRKYSTYTDEELYVRFKWLRLKRNPGLAFQPNYNTCPTQIAPIIRRADDGAVQLELFRWGLIPFWAKDVASASKYSLINAKGEEINEKRSYSQAFAKRRCVVPVSGFYEWKRPPEGTKAPKRPFAISLKNEPIMLLAGIYEHWESQDKPGEVIDSFSVVTTAANEFMEKIHNRMPVILDEKGVEAWLDPETTPEAAKQLLKPCPSSWLKAVEVSAAVNSPKNNRPELLEPIGELNPSELK